MLHGVLWVVRNGMAGCTLLCSVESISQQSGAAWCGCTRLCPFVTDLVVTTRLVLRVRPTGRGDGGVGMRANKKFMYLKWDSHFWIYPKFHFSSEENFFGFGWVGGRVGGSARSLPWISTSLVTTRYVSVSPRTSRTDPRPSELYTMRYPTAACRTSNFADLQ